MFWTKGADSFNKLRQLTQEIRIQDPWLREFLEECRHGRQSWSNYYFIHGYPTREPGSWMAHVGELDCGSKWYKDLMENQWPE